MSFADSLKGLAKIIPGVTGYMSREEVRNADKVVREHVAKNLDQIKARVDDAKRAMVDGKKLGALGPLDRLTSRIDRLRNQVRTATYGHSSFFADFKVDEAVLAQVVDFDRALGERVASLGEKAAALVAAGDDESRATQAAKDMETEVQAMDEAFTGRDKILGK